MTDRYDISGRRFGLRVAISPAGGINKHGSRLWNCICDCGQQQIVSRSNLALSASCGCLQKKAARLRASHGHAHRGKKRHTRTYRAHANMLSRCRNPRLAAYPLYGARGITVCERWSIPGQGFQNFLADLGQCPDGYSLDRIDPDGNYEPGNVRWATFRNQVHNRSKIVFNTAYSHDHVAHALLMENYLA